MLLRSLRRAVFHHTAAAVACIACLFGTANLKGQDTLPGAGNSTRWSIYPLLTSEDTLPRTRPGARFSTRIWRDPVAPSTSGVAVSDGMVLHTNHGIFVVTKDSIVPIVTELDSIPGSNAVFADIDDYGLPRLAVKHFELVGARRVVFTYLHDSQLSFYEASPGTITRIFSLPSTLTVAGGTFETSKTSTLDRIWGWSYGLPESRPTVLLLWDTDWTSPGRLGRRKDYVLLFSFDGQRAEKLIAEGDTVGSGEIVYLARDGRGQCIQLPVFDVTSHRTLLVAQVREAHERHLLSAVLLVSQGQQTTQVARSRQEIPSLPGVDLGDVYSCHYWEADIAHGRVLFESWYHVGGKNFYGSFVASTAGLEQIASWRVGDTLTDLDGRIGRLLDRFSIVNPESHDLISLVTISDSRQGVEEAILSFARGVVQKLVAQKDSAPSEVGGVFRHFGEKTLLNDRRDLVFQADVEGGRARGGLFLLSDGTVSRIVADGDSVSDRRNMGPPKVFSLSDMRAITVVSDRSLVFWARGSASVTEGWFLAVRE